MVNSLVDSGSSESLVPTNVIQQSRYPICEYFYNELVLESGNQLEVMGRIRLTFLVGDMKTVQYFMVVSESAEDKNLAIRGKTCWLAKSSVRYLGYVFTSDGKLQILQ